MTGGLPGALDHPGPTLLYPQAEGRGNVWLTKRSSGQRKTLAGLLQRQRSLCHRACLAGVPARGGFCVEIQIIRLAAYRAVALPTLALPAFIRISHRSSLSIYYLPAAGAVDLFAA